MFSALLQQEGRQQRSCWHHDIKVNFNEDASDQADDEPLPLNIPMDEDDEEVTVKQGVNKEDGYRSQVPFVYPKQESGVEIEYGNQVVPEKTCYFVYDYGVNQEYLEPVHQGAYHEYEYFNYNPDQVYFGQYHQDHGEVLYEAVPYYYPHAVHQIPILESDIQDVDEKSLVSTSVVKQELSNESILDGQDYLEQVSEAVPVVLQSPLVLSYPSVQVVMSQKNPQEDIQQDDLKLCPSSSYVKQESSDENMFISDVIEDNNDYNDHMFEKIHVIHYRDSVPYPNSDQSVFDDSLQSFTSDDLIAKTEFQTLKRRKIKKSKRRNTLKKNNEFNNATFPDGFEQVLERASTTGDVNNHPQKQKIGKNEELEAIRKRDLRRCETKIMLQSVDGTLFNKFFEEDDIREFAKKFKILRTDYGFSQSNVGEALGRRYGLEFSQTTISRFESLVLSHTNMCKLRPPIEAWLNDVKNALNAGMTTEDIKNAYRNEEIWTREQPNEDATSLVLPVRKRKRRTSLEIGQKVALEAFFAKNQKPNNDQMMDISESLDLSFEVVRVWFSNRRQKFRKINAVKKGSFYDYENDDLCRVNVT